MVYPPADDIFNALHLTPLSEVKVLILGQDPYHNEHQAHGLSFPYCRIRKRFHHLYRTSIKNYRMTLAAISLTMVIWKMGKAGCIIIEHGSDRPCTSGEFPSGQRMGAFYGCHYPGGQCPGSTSCLYAVGQTGTEQIPMLTNPKHLILKAPHPSPLSAYRGFFGCKHFSQANAF